MMIFSMHHSDYFCVDYGYLTYLRARLTLLSNFYIRTSTNYLHCRS